MRRFSVVHLSIGLLAALVVLAGVVVINALRLHADPHAAPALAGVGTADEAAAAERLADAVRFQTISPHDPRHFDPQAFLGLHAFLERTYPGVHRTLRREVVNDYSVLYTWPGADDRRKPILLSAHLDVVPIDPVTVGTWAHPPFSGRIADGYVWGRGAMDDKASVLGLLEAVEGLVSQGFVPSRTVYLAFGHDEEVGGTRGAAGLAALLTARGVRLESVIDEGSLITHGLIPGVGVPVAIVGVAEKGRLAIELTARGDSGHSSIPPVHGAIGILSTAIHRLEANPLPATLRRPVTDLFTGVAPEMTFPRRLVLANLWLFGPLVTRQLTGARTTNALVRTTAAVTMVRAGAAENVLPADAKAIVNYRILPGDSSRLVIEHVRRVVADSSVDVQVLHLTEPSPVSDTNSVIYRALAAAVREVFPEAVVAPGLVVAGTDSKHYLSLTDSVYRFVPFRLAPADLGRIHGVDERIGVTNYAEIIAFYVQFLRRAAS